MEKKMKIVLIGKQMAMTMILVNLRKPNHKKARGKAEHPPQSLCRILKRLRTWKHLVLQ